MEGNKQMREQLTKAKPTIHYDRNKDLALRASSGIEGSTSKRDPTRESTSGDGFFKRCPFWWRKERAAKSLQEEAVPKSRLCMETAHESPIPAVRKPAPREETLGWLPGEESAGAKPGSSLLRKLLCLKVSPSRMKEPPHGLEASPLYRASMGCGPVAALSRTADPQGESPLRWKPRAESHSPAEATSNGAEMDMADTTAKPEGSWITKPWRTFRTAITSRVKKRSILPGIESNQGATEDGDLHIPTEQESSSNPKTNTAFGEHMTNRAAIEDQKPSAAFPANVDNAHSIQENKRSQRVSWHGMEIHRTAEDDTLGPNTEAKEEKSTSLTLEGGRWEQNLVHKNVSEWDNLQKQVYNLLRGNGAEVEETAREDEDLEQGRCAYWVEGLMEEEEDLADLAENPGGQGMLMATRDLRWLSNELLGGPKSWEKEKKVAREIDQAQDSEGKTITEDASDGDQRNGKVPLDLATDMSHITSFLFPPPFPGSDPSHVVESLHYDTSGTDTPEEEGTLFPQDGQPLTPLEFPPSSFSTKSLEQGLLSPPPLKPYEMVAEDNEREGQQGLASPTRKMLPFTQEMHQATTWLDATAPGAEVDKQLIYMAAVEIVGATIDAVAVHLAKKEEEEQTESGLNKQAP
ncbi:uncharacterized protein LOC121915904 isoform X1 [Sceloporus undulatus]|uniref:uncharacterized protein LOC121915904 isoform X1 n=1 Tax=Sceloporus undulatus TaxID=8520 RepID=UPI001C4BCED7|nr:uncharacterized protein LOC121915904 isoform X1 [Sceloporus undulatus]XP_042296462.1 uncharacterized protein LOC121915904 isoform X1 [Sceloporus undulatus]XP_042296463.1 uncharacterized protein LOC121915904 isoform X1 [Sceloporus undulatus]